MGNVVSVCIGIIIFGVQRVRSSRAGRSHYIESILKSYVWWALSHKWERTTTVSDINPRILYCSSLYFGARKAYFGSSRTLIA